MGDNTNEKGLEKLKTKKKSPIVVFIALNPKCHSFNHLTLDDVNKDLDKEDIAKGYLEWLLNANFLKKNHYINSQKTIEQIKIML